MRRKKRKERRVVDLQIESPTAVKATASHCGTEHRKRLLLVRSSSSVAILLATRAVRTSGFSPYVLHTAPLRKMHIHEKFLSTF